ncbi:Holliday junction branch migration protein RuvA [Desulfatiglans anilini]|uniref:Holliday junction branch migration protein RuvA n=1 Tax=Desulfatiglans anilini TaxID=90728 RepID=UPI00041BE4E9|nr:Holliday junction branch migration protein RuvA [Desulfatiglans anilini]
MIAFLRGILLKKNTQSLTIDVSGVGYEVLVPLSTLYHLAEEGEAVALHIHTRLRDDTLQLFGFQTEIEKELFLMLTTVSGIGPRLAVNILSGIGPHELLDAIAEGNAPGLQAIPGIGKKTSERISLELKDRALKARNGLGTTIAETATTPGENQFLDDALSALLNLGYSQKAAREAVERAGAAVAKPNLETVIREALRLLA